MEALRCRLTAPCYPDFNGNNYGAVEPVILELKDGRIWMLVRTQTGYLCESFRWMGNIGLNSHPRDFILQLSGISFTAQRDERIVLFWNNCEMPPRVNGDGVYGGRDAIHAAISDNEGETWYAFREVYRDPARNEPRRSVAIAAQPTRMQSKQPTHKLHW